MREIGSEFWDIPICDKKNNLFPETTQWFLSGRSTLQAIILQLGKTESVSLPSWCCESMIKPFTDAGIKVHFYPVYPQDGRLIQETDFDSDVLFIMDYFGYTSLDLDLSNYKSVVIRDVTHSIFSASYKDADYYFGSLRKWCGVWTGGYAWGKKRLTISGTDGKYIGLRKQAMEDKENYIAGITNDKGYLKIYEEAENLLESCGTESADEQDITSAMSLDIELIKERRRSNAEILRSAFSDWLIFKELKATDTPMFVPILVPDGKRNALRRYLIENSIYCPVHWPVSEYHNLDAREQRLYDNELSLVCDQRYTEEDMYRIVEVIDKFWKGN